MSRLHLFTLSTAVAGAGALAAMALNFSFTTVFLFMCAATGLAFASVISEYAVRRKIERLNHVIGQFMRGHWQTRETPEAGDDEWVRLQHRLNNVLDVIDVHLHGDQAAIDPTTHAEYIEKLKTTPLAMALACEENGGEASAPAKSVGALLQQLGHDVAGLFDGEGEPEEAADPTVEETTDAVLHETDLLALSGRLRAAALDLQDACTRLSQKALPTGFSGGGPSPATLEVALARMAEQVTVMALNATIEATRAGEATHLHSMAEELQDMAVLLQKAQQEVGAALAPHHRQGGPVTVPLAAAIEALALAEQHLRSEAQAVDAWLAPDADVPSIMEEAA